MVTAESLNWKNIIGDSRNSALRVTKKNCRIEALKLKGLNSQTEA